jgi:hypothetical protein
VAQKQENLKMGAAGSIEGRIGFEEFKHLREEYEVV